MEPKMTPTFLQCIVVTPEKAVLDETCDFVALPMFDGELGVLPGRRPLIGRLGFGELRTVHGKTVHRYYVDGGFVQVRKNTITVLTSKAIKAEDIKVAAAEEILQHAGPPPATPEALDAKVKNQQRARAQLRVARHAAESTPASH
jgi:F-type H+-transporting ATPase subunit epsilon